MSNAAKSEKLTPEAAQRAAQRIQHEQQMFDRASFPLHQQDVKNIIIEELGVAASAEVSELREALRKYGEHTVNCQYWDCSSTCNCGWRAILKKHGDGI